MRIDSLAAKAATMLGPLVMVLLQIPFNSATPSPDHDQASSKWDFLPTDSCGFGYPSDRIVGGEEAALGQFPWMVRLGYSRNNTIQYLCGGSVINRWYVVTANHCFEGDLGKDIKQVRVGENFVNDAIDCQGGVCAPPVQDLDLDHYLRYDGPKLEKSVVYGDIALIKVAKPIRFHDYVQPICLPTPLVREKEDLSPGTKMTVAGWGSIDPIKYIHSKRLMYVQVPVIDSATCQQSFKSTIIDNSHICAGVGKGRDSCVGDSGGPLMKAVSVDGPPVYVLFGVVSYGLRVCGQATAVYTNVSHHLDWILENIDPIH